MEYKVNFTAIGLFVLLLTAAVLAAIGWLLLGGEAKFYDRYRVYTHESVSGLNAKAAVKYKGVDVGRVAAVELDAENPERIDILLEIERGTPIMANTQAILVTQGLTGLMTVELSGGTRDALPLAAQPGEVYPVIASGPSLISRLDDAFTTMAGQFDTLANRLGTLLGDDNQGTVKQMLENLNQISAAVAGMLNDGNRRLVRETLTHVNSISGALAVRVDTLGQGLDAAALTLDNSARVSGQLTPLIAQLVQSLANIDKTAVTITRTSQNLDQAVQDSRRDLLQIANETGPEITGLVAELRQFTAGLQRLGRELERDPRALLFGKQPKQLGPGE